MGCLRCCCVVCRLYCLITVLFSTSFHVRMYVYYIRIYISVCKIQFSSFLSQNCIIIKYIHTCVYVCVCAFNSPLDELIDKLGGPGNVAEMTGRKGRVVRVTGKEDQVHYEQRDNGGCELDSVNNTEVRRAAFSLLNYTWQKNCIWY